jgi:hypothetical protein
MFKEGDIVEGLYKLDQRWYRAVILKVVTDPDYILLGRLYRIKFLEGRAKDDHVYVGNKQIRAVK